MIKSIYCTGCQTEVDAKLTDGKEIYPHRNDLHELPFWKCPDCGLHVGCHHKTKDRTKPLGCIPTKEIKSARRHLHKIIDPLWKSGKIKRAALYKMISDHLGWDYHTGNTMSIQECRHVYTFVSNLSKANHFQAEGSSK